MQGNHNTMIKRIVDVCMTVLLLCLMAYQVTGEALHEWIGIGMTVLVIIHQILNRKWYGAIFKGKYNPYRIATTVANIALLLSFVLTAFCGMSMSSHAVPFLYGMTKVPFARRMHLSMSHWAFVLMGLHLGMHIPVMFAKLKLADKVRMVISLLFCLLSGIGLFLFIKNGMPGYLFFRVPFAFLDYEKAGILVFLENILMLTFWVYIGTQVAVICRDSQMKNEEKKNPLLPVIFIMAAIIIGLMINMILGGTSGDKSGVMEWSGYDTEAINSSPEEAVADASTTDNSDMDDYDTILLGYPNWWASIPMPIASFLEEYDFSGKRIIPFCSHGGGRFGQSLTAIAKLAPDADMGEGLSVHYSGGSTLSEDIQNWLDINGINK